jgi:hypothetical protein
MRGPHPELHVSIVIVYKYIIIVFIECNKDHDLIAGEYIIRSCVLLTPKHTECVEGIGSLVNIEICKDFRRIKDDSKKEELCTALACPEVEWENTENTDCKKWYHIHCVGIARKEELPERWWCGIETFNENDLFR